MTIKDANDDFASYWPTLFFGWMLLYYLFSSVLFQFTSFSYTELFFVMSGVGALVTVVAFHVTVGVPDEPVKKDVLKQASETLIMTFSHPQAVALAPISVSYGFGMMFVQDYMNDVVVSTYMGDYALGYCGAIQAAIVVALAAPWSTLSKSQGKGVVLAIATIAYVGVLVPFFFSNSEGIGKWQFVVPIYLAYGVARLSWENTGYV